LICLGGQQTIHWLHYDEFSFNVHPETDMSPV